MKYLKNFKWRVLIVAVIKFILAGYLLYTYQDAKHKDFAFTYFASDNNSYVEPFKNLYGNNCYCINGEPYAGRMPSVGAVYYLARFVLGHTVALNMVVLFQIIVDILATTLIFSIAFRLFRSYKIAALAFFIYAVFPYITLFDLKINTESLATSCLVISFYGLLSWRGRYILLLVSGLLFTFSVFNRPFLIPLVVPMMLMLLLNARWNTGFKRSIAFVTPLMICLVLWTVRNSITMNKPIVLQSGLHAGYNYDPIFYPIGDFVKAWGGEFHPNNPKGEGRWFYQFDEEGPFPWQDNFDNKGEIPDDIYTDQFNYDTLLNLKSMIKARYLTKDTTTRNELDSIIIAQVNSYTHSFKKEKPFYYHVWSRFKLLRFFLFHSGTYNLTYKKFPDLSLFEKTVKLFWSANYLFVVVFSLLALAFLWPNLKKQHYEVLLLYALAYYSILLFPIAMRKVEYRYLCTSFPFMVLLAAYTYNRGWQQLRKFLPGEKNGSTT